MDGNWVGSGQVNGGEIMDGAWNEIYFLLFVSLKFMGILQTMVMEAAKTIQNLRYIILPPLLLPMTLLLLTTLLLLVDFGAWLFLYCIFSSIHLPLKSRARAPVAIMPILVQIQI